jgi:hypothetical protein
MNLDYVLFSLILCGIVLAGICFRSEYLHLRDLRAIERRREKLMHELHLERLSAQAGDSKHAARIS